MSCGRHFVIAHIFYGRFHALLAPALYGMVHDGKVLIAAVGCAQQILKNKTKQKHPTSLHREL